MAIRRSRLKPILFAAGAALLATNAAWALGRGLGETKEQLQLDYRVEASDHGTGRVTVSVTIADPGRLKPLSSVGLNVPSKDGTGYVDLSLPIATQMVDGKMRASVHLKRDLAERAEIHLTTSTLDGKQSPRTWYYYTIPIAKYLPVPKKD
jgi:hypothetical protein